MSKTQILAARAGEITPEMQACARREELPVETIRDEVAAGRMVIPANKVHAAGALEPMCIGIAAKCKINANIGNSAVTSNVGEELDKLPVEPPAVVREVVRDEPAPLRQAPSR